MQPTIRDTLARLAAHEYLLGAVLIQVFESFPAEQRPQAAELLIRGLIKANAAAGMPSLAWANEAAIIQRQAAETVAAILNQVLDRLGDHPSVEVPGRA